MVTDAIDGADRPRRAPRPRSTASCSTSRTSRRRRGAPRRRAAGPGRRGHRRARRPQRPRSSCRATRRSSTARSGSAPTCRSPARAASAAPAGPGSPTARCTMRRNFALEQDEVDAGYVLTCQSLPDHRPRHRRLRRLSTEAHACTTARRRRRTSNRSSAPRSTSFGRCNSTPQWSLRTCLRQRRPLPAGLRRARRASGRLQGPRRPRAIPVHRKADLRDNYPFGMFAVPSHRSHGSMRPAAPPAVRPSSATPQRTSSPGRR